MKRLVVVAVLLAAVFTAASLGATFQQAGDVDADETVTKVDLDQNGDAVFTLEIRIRLNTDEKREAFEGFADDVDEDPDAAVSDFRESIESLVDRARDETGREMTVSGFAVETRSEPLPVERGIVEYRFDWDGFAADANDGIEAGDVLSGYILGDSDALVFRYPDGYEVDSVEPSPDLDDDELRWDGPRDFDDDQPRAVFVPAGEPPVDDPGRHRKRRRSRSNRCSPLRLRARPRRHPRSRPVRLPQKRGRSRRRLDQPTARTRFGA